MRYIFYIIGIGAVVALTFGLFNVWGWHGFVPNILLLAIVSLALAFHNFDYLFIGLIGGVWFDTVYGVPIGSFSIPFLLIGTGSSLVFQKWLFTEVAWKHFIVTVIIATLFLNLWLWLYTSLLFMIKWSPLVIDPQQLLRNMVLVLIANVLLAYPVYVIVELVAQSTSKLRKNRIRL
ncbi:MAG: hypothetical protein M3Q64_02615 [bacterium]|nr:hypothetical protein [bacterium]